MRPLIWLILLFCPIANFPTTFAQEPAATTAADEVTWDEVRGVFQKRCFACHRGEQARGGLDLSTVAAIRAGSTSGAAVVSGKPEESLIYTLPAHLEDPKMPPSGNKLPQRELDIISRWIQGGLSEKVRESSAPNPATRPAAGGRRMSPARPGMASAARPQIAASPFPAAAADSSSITTNPVFVSPVRHQRRAITAMAASPVSSLLAVPGNREVFVFDWSDQSLHQKIAFPYGDVFTLRFSTDGSLLIVGGGVGAESGRAAGFNVLTGEQVFLTGEESDVVLTADLAPNGRYLAVGGPFRKVRVYDTTSGQLTAEITKHTDWVLQLAFSHDNLLLASADRFGAVLVSEPASGKEFASLRGHSGPISGLAWSQDSTEVLSAGHDGSIRIRELHGSTERLVLQPQIGKILNAQFLPGGGAVVGTADHRLATVTPAGVVQVLAELPDEVTKLAVTQDSSHVLAADAAGNLTLHQLIDGRNVPLPAVVAGSAE
jgi:mono/diheme cytochrome c family protein